MEILAGIASLENEAVWPLRDEGCNEGLSVQPGWPQDEIVAFSGASSTSRVAA